MTMTDRGAAVIVFMVGVAVLDQMSLMWMRTWPIGQEWFSTCASAGSGGASGGETTAASKLGWLDEVAVVVAPPEDPPPSPPTAAVSPPTAMIWPPVAATAPPRLPNGLCGKDGLKVVVPPWPGTTVTLGSSPERGCEVQLHSTRSMLAPRKNQRVRFHVARASLRTLAHDWRLFKD